MTEEIDYRVSQKPEKIMVLNLLILVVAFSLCIGCITNNQISGNYENPLASRPQIALTDIYTAPIGGFNENMIVMDPNDTYTTNYTFYSRNWEGGWVDYQVQDRNGQNFFGSDKINVTISPSHFIAGPGQAYSSRLVITTGQDFDQMNSINFIVELQGNKKHYANDTLSVNQIVVPGMGILSQARIEIENQTFSLKRGGSRQVNVTFHHGISGMEQVTYSISDSPLNITITPRTFISTKKVTGGFPAILSVSAASSVPPGRYQFHLNINRSDSIFYSHQSNHGYSTLIPQQYDFAVDVT